MLDYLSQPLPRKLTLITASAGYGKTTIATQWLDQLIKTRQEGAISIAWLSLDEHDDELLLFLRYLVAAIQKACPGFGRNILHALHGAQSPTWQQIADSLVNDLAHIAQPLCLTLDDYHVITADAIHQVLNRLLEHLPPIVHLILLSRTEPPLALGRLRVRRQMQELRAADLTFSLQDTAHFMSRMLGRELRPETLQTLYAGSEGWIAGLQLTALSLPRATDEGQLVDDTALLRHFRGNNAYHMDYLFEEILVLQPPAIQAFLLQTAIFERFCAPLCQAVLDSVWFAQIEEEAQGLTPIAASPAPIQAVFSWLRRANLFLIPLDGEGVWYRYHHLFQQMLEQTLRARLSAAQIAMLHRRASAWLAAEGVTESAIRHALAAGDALLAAQLIEQQRYHLLSQHDFPTLDRWLSWLPSEVIVQRPALLVAQGWRHYFFYRARETFFRFATQAEAQLASSDLGMDAASKQILAGEIHALKAFSLPWHSHADEIWRHIELAFAQTPEGTVFLYPYLVLMKAYALNTQGNVTEAHAFLETAQRTIQRTSSAAGMVAGFAQLINFVNGKLSQCASVYEQLWKMESNHQSNHGPFLSSVLHAYLGSIYYEWNQLDKAAVHLTAVLDITHGYSLGAFKRGGLILAALYQAQGRFVEAVQVLERLYQLDVAKESDYFRHEVQSFHANLLLREGAMAEALQQFHLVKPEPLYLIDAATEFSMLTQAQLLIVQGGEQNLAQAAEILQTQKATTGPLHHRGRRIHVLALEALLQRAAGRQKEALTALEEAIILAKPDHFIRTFVDLGPDLVQLLEQLRRQQIEPDYIGQILMAYPLATQAPQTMRPSQPAQPQPLPPATKLVEPLTEREREILVLLAERLSNKEIAHLLAVSPFTVKNHLSTIYQKLGVSGRRQAVNHAGRAGLLH
ncbi:MAG: hypothetical protein HC802_00475 [Caldilineaceae bacterium]|nr:hypothetical protein [Caldilineaceae bacterium]